jgi:hypothetical protein
LAGAEVAYDGRMKMRRGGWVVAMMVACGGSGDETAGASTTDSGITVPQTSTDGTTTQVVPTTSPDETTGSAVTGGFTTTTSAPTTGPATDTVGETVGESTVGESTSGESTVGESTSGDFCAGMGGVELPGDLTGCTGDLGKKTFLFALCSCNDLTANNMLTTDSFDSEMGMMPMDGGSVGVNGAYSASSNIDIGGSLWVDGTIQSFNNHEVAQVLQCGGNVTAKSTSHVGEEAFVEGDIEALNMVMTIDGDLHIPADKTNNQAIVGGQTIQGPVDVEIPCDCEDPYDITAIVAGYQAINTNAEQGIAADELVDLSDPKVLELPCGIYFFDKIQSNNELTIKLTGRTVIAIAGDIINAGSFIVELGPDAELDLFLAGNATLNNVAAIGDPTRPAATRLYVGGEVKFANTFTLGANLYMPNKVFTANNSAEIWGSLFVGGLQLASPVVIHYDSAVLDLEGCEDPGGGCGDCHDCANPTPSCGENGTCEPCEVNADCCPPLACDGGICKAVTPG